MDVCRVCSESAIDADTRHLRGQVARGADGVRVARDNRAEDRTGCRNGAEVQVEVLSLDGPVSAPHPFKAAADSPTNLGCRAAPGPGAGTSIADDYGIVDERVGRTKRLVNASPPVAYARTVPNAQPTRPRAV